MLLKANRLLYKEKLSEGEAKNENSEDRFYGGKFIKRLVGEQIILSVSRVSGVSQAF